MNSTDAQNTLEKENITSLESLVSVSFFVDLFQCNLIKI